eukprot:COSAG05_NODE_87_length_20404_cov_42.272051_23_plen_100_part_00
MQHAENITTMRWFVPDNVGIMDGLAKHGAMTVGVFLSFLTTLWLIDLFFTNTPTWKPVPAIGVEIPTDEKLTHEERAALTGAVDRDRLAWPEVEMKLKK